MARKGPGGGPRRGIRSGGSRRGGLRSGSVTGLLVVCGEAPWPGGVGGRAAGLVSAMAARFSVRVLAPVDGAVPDGIVVDALPDEEPAARLVSLLSPQPRAGRALLGPRRSRALLQAVADHQPRAVLFAGGHLAAGLPHHRPADLRRLPDAGGAGEGAGGAQGPLVGGGGGPAGGGGVGRVGRRRRPPRPRGAAGPCWWRTGRRRRRGVPWPTRWRRSWGPRPDREPDVEPAADRRRDAAGPGAGAVAVGPGPRRPLGGRRGRAAGGRAGPGRHRRRARHPGSQPGAGGGRRRRRPGGPAGRAHVEPAGHPPPPPGGGRPVAAGAPRADLPPAVEAGRAVGDRGRGRRPGGAGPRRRPGRRRPPHPGAGEGPVSRPTASTRRGRPPST